MFGLHLTLRVGILVRQQNSRVVRAPEKGRGPSYPYAAGGSEAGWTSVRKTTTSNKRVPPALTSFAPGNTARGAGRVGTLERYAKARISVRGVDIGRWWLNYRQMPERR